jgi:hypothetical protein
MSPEPVMWRLRLQAISVFLFRLIFHNVPSLYRSVFLVSFLEQNMPVLQQLLQPRRSPTIDHLLIPS